MSHLAALAKVNLFLHVGERRFDGLHDLSSLVMRASFGDVIGIAPSDKLVLTVCGPVALEVPQDGDNLVLAAAGMLDPSGVAHIELEKQLPVGAGLGGGSADAAAAMILLNRHWGCGYGIEELCARGMAIGADVPACLHGGPVVVRGGGEMVAPIAVPDLNAVVVDAGEHVSTAEVFARFDGLGCSARSVAAIDIDGLEPFEVITLLAERTGNDLTEAAVSVCPGIAEVLEMLASDDDVILARMSGSGGACFGLCAGPEDARAISSRILSCRPGWWVRDCVLRGSYRC